MQNIAGFTKFLNLADNKGEEDQEKMVLIKPVYCQTECDNVNKQIFIEVIKNRIT